MGSDPARTRRPIRRALASTLAAQLLLAGGLRATVLSPERCPPPDLATVRVAIDAAVEWFAVNGEPDGRWLYRYHPAEDRAERAYNLVRHAGTLVALEQAAAAGWDDAALAAEHGWHYVEAHLVPSGDGLAFVDAAVGGRTADAGAAALVSVAWTYRLDRLGVAPGAEPVELLGLARFLLGQIEPSGAVAAFRRADGVVEPVRSRFYTGEVAWAMQRLAARRQAVGAGLGAGLGAGAGSGTASGAYSGAVSGLGVDGAVLGDAAVRTLRYLTTERDGAERWFPAIADHWAAYALADAAAPELLPKGAEPYRATLAGRFAVQVRWESQRRVGSGWSSLTKGRPATGAAIGTLGEGLAALGRDAARRDAAADDAGDAADDAAAGDARRAGLRRQLGCVAGLLVARQVLDADGYPAPSRVRGSWVASGVTQVDDQQHALSALLGYADEVGA